MSRYFLQLSYDGTDYHGWQVQDNAATVQEVVNEKLSLILSEKIDVMGCGRTDAGVHATNFYAHFDAASDIDIDQIKFKLNSVFPKDIAAIALHKLEDDAHARFDAISRTYHYKLHVQKNPFLRSGSFNIRKQLDVKAMNEAGSLILGEHDFSCFSKSGTQVKTNICNVTEAVFDQINESELVFIITADRFLRNMVRAVVGTMIEIGEGKQDPSQILKVLESKDRGHAGTSVPAHGLYLVDIKYPYL